MDAKLYVGNLSYETTEEDLRELFTGAGVVTSVALIKDRDTGRSKGFAFVEMSSQSEAEEAIKLFNGKTLGNREIKVNIARPKEERPGGSGGFGGRSGSGFGGGGGGGKRDQSRNRKTGGSGPRRY
jgi:RNA recognition motif-containing protein